VLAKALEAAFAGNGAATLGLDPETSARAGAWIPTGIAYGAVHDEESPKDADDVDEPDRSDADPGSDTETVPAFLTADSSPANAEASEA